MENKNKIIRSPQGAQINSRTSNPHKCCIITFHKFIHRKIRNGVAVATQIRTKGEKRYKQT